MTPAKTATARAVGNLDDFASKNGITPAVLDGDAVLTQTQAFLKRFIAFPDEHALTAVTLWAAHAHMVEHFHTTPRLALLSPEPASGKTRVLEVLHLLVPEPMFSLIASPATVFRKLRDKQLVLLVDECDTIFQKRGKDDTDEGLRGLLNAGYKRGATVPRCVGPKHEVIDFPVFCPTALAGLGDLPDTIMSRSVIIKMQRRAPSESVEPFRTRKHEGEGHALRDQIAAWASIVGSEAGDAWPELPGGIEDRNAEIWEPLIAVADAAGGQWPDVARTACIAMCRAAADRKMSLGIRLLSDLRIIFGDAIALHTETILDRLFNHDPLFVLGADAPWSELHGKGLTVRGLASMLKRYGVGSQKVTVDGKSLQGYRLEHLWDAWTRYLPPSDPVQAELPESAELFKHESGGGVPEIPQVPDFRRPEGDTFTGPCIPSDVLAQRRELMRVLAIACRDLATSPRAVASKLAEVDYADVIACPKTARTFAESVAAGLH